HTGHGIGISANEAPYITPDSGDILREGMTITLEPGLYFDTWGARIEDDYLITPGGFEKLTGSENS
ncbi:MAG: M24 family metallopeptidase, partial [Spirochaetes bacterium]|nr:M24 family metallopeptidase [Spirochaetota bacterium]